MTYTDIMQSAGKEINPSIFYTISGTTTTIGHDDIISAKLYFNAPLVGTIMKGLSVELNDELPVETPIYFKNIATFGINTANKTYGPYYVKESQYNADTKTYSIELYDEFLNTMVDYQPITIAYPTTVYAFFIQVLTELGFTTQIASLPNGSQTVKSDVYNGINYTYRDVLDDIAQATGCCFKVSGSEVSIATLGTTAISINDDILKNENIDFGEHYGAINTIVLSRGGGADNIYYPDPLPATPVEFKITDNQLMNDDDRSNFMADIYSQLNGIEYDIYDTELVGYGGFEPLDEITISTVDADGNTKTYNSYVFNDEQTFTQGYSETIYTTAPSEAVSDYKVMTPTDKLINKTNLVVDKVNGTITGLVSEVDNINTMLEGYYEITSDATFQANKSYYILDNGVYRLVEQYSLTDDTTYQSGTDYYTLSGDTYVLLIPGTDYQIGDTITGSVYEQNYAIGGAIPSDTYYELIQDNSLERRMSQAEATLTAQGLALDVVSTNIDPETGDILSLRRMDYELGGNGFIIDDGSGFKSVANTTGQYYYDNNTMIGKYTKDGSVQKDMGLYGKYYYGVSEDVNVETFSKDDAMFVAQLYEDSNNETGFGHFYNGS